MGTFIDTPTSMGGKFKYLTPSDTADIDDLENLKAVVFVSGGSATMIGRTAPPGATGVSWPNMPSYYTPPAVPKRILATGTDAGIKILGIY